MLKKDDCRKKIWMYIRQMGSFTMEELEFLLLLDGECDIDIMSIRNFIYGLYHKQVIHKIKADLYTVDVEFIHVNSEQLENYLNCYSISIDDKFKVVALNDYFFNSTFNYTTK